METRHQVRHGMMVRTADGVKLGSIVDQGPTSFLVEKGFFFQKEYDILYSDIDSVVDDEVILRFTRAELRGGVSEVLEAPPPPPAEARPIAPVMAPVPEPVTARVPAPAPARPAVSEQRAHEARASAAPADQTELRIPLAEEEIRVHKEVHDAGKVRIRKELVTEEQTVTVPVTREVIRVEHVPPGDETRLGEAITEKDRRRRR